jgi:peptidoglycan/LPS O-acetylase OafA/YrhL
VLLTSADPRTPWHLGHRPALDGIRGIAILLVMICHFTGRGLWRGSAAVGTAGVEVFFVLSGFLITSLLVEEYAKAGEISLARFYERRARRLLPALALLVAVCWLLGVVAGVRQPVLPTLFYYANWTRDLGLLGHTWSLSVEEQFYIAWPLVLIASLRWRTGPVVVAGLGAAASLLARFAHHDPWSLYRSTDTEAWGLLLGSLLAILAHRGLPELRMPSWMLALLVAPLFALAFVPGFDFGYVWVSALAPALAVPLVWGSCCHGAITWSPLGYLGRRSYGLYLWHAPVILALSSTGPLTPVTMPIAIVLSFVLAELSWRFIESPFLRSRQRFQPLSDPPAAKTSLPA